MLFTYFADEFLFELIGLQRYLGPFQGMVSIDIRITTQCKKHLADIRATQSPPENNLVVTSKIIEPDGFTHDWHIHKANALKFFEEELNHQAVPAAPQTREIKLVNQNNLSDNGEWDVL